MQKPNLKPVGEPPVTVIPAPEREDTPAVKEARRKFGKPFAGERGFRGEWKSGPTVLTDDRMNELRIQNAANRKKRK